MPHEEHCVAKIALKALIVERGKVLIVFDRKWELPGGRLHVHELPVDGLRREVGEELGAQVAIGPIHDAYTFVTNSGAQHFAVIYQCNLLPDSPPPKPDGKELTDMKWVSSVEDLEGLEFYPGYRETVTKFFNAN